MSSLYETHTLNADYGGVGEAPSLQGWEVCHLFRRLG